MTKDEAMSELHKLPLHTPKTLRVILDHDSCRMVVLGDGNKPLFRAEPTVSIQVEKRKSYDLNINLSKENLLAYGAILLAAITLIAIVVFH